MMFVCHVIDIANKDVEGEDSWRRAQGGADLERLPLSRFPLESVSKFGKMHFRRLDMHFSVAFPRFTSSKPSSKRLELQADPLETAHSSF